MGFLDHSTNNIIVDAVLTDTGRAFLARNDGSFSIVKFALGDDEVDYTIIEKFGRTVGKEKIEKNTPIFEAQTSGNLALKYKMISVSNPNLIRLPNLSLTGEGIDSSGTTLSMSRSGAGSARTLTITQEIQNESSIDVELRDQVFLVKVPSRFLQLKGLTPDNVDADNVATYIVTRDPTTTSTGGSRLTFEVETKSLTAEYLNKNNLIEIPQNRRKSKSKIYLKGCRENNLKNINVEIPLNSLVCITGISGSGKTTLVKEILYPALLKEKGIFKEKPGEFDKIGGNLDKIDSIEYIDQNPIGTSSRSNPATYIKAYDDIRNLFSLQKTAKQFSLKPKHFSFNVDGGRCDECKGEGEIKIEMQFMSDIKLKCESCKGKRFKKPVLQVEYMDKNIDDILTMTIDNAYAFFLSNNQNKIASKLKCLIDVGMGYVNVGQSSSTLSGGEAQRIKLASFLLKGKNKENTLFIFDEPTTGLHFHDIKKLLKSFNYLIEFGHSIIVVEHNIDLIKSSDHIIDLGPYGGDKGGEVVFTGTPEQLVKDKNSLLSKFLKPKFSFK